jgi:hypothetical protein
MQLPKSTQASAWMEQLAYPGTTRFLERSGLQPLGKGGGGGNPCPNGRVVCAALGNCNSNPFSGACGTRESATVIGSCNLGGGQQGQQCCCTPF